MKLVAEVSENNDSEPTINNGINGNHSISITSLLPETYLGHPLSDKNVLKNCLTHYFFSLAILQDSFLHFLDHQYRKFDALVGNNSCYATAYVVFKTAQKVQDISEFKSQLISILKKIEKIKMKALSLLNGIDDISFGTSDFNFRDFLRHKRLILDLPTDFLYLGLAFGCAASKKTNANDMEEIHYESLLLRYQQKLGIPLRKKSTIKLIKHWQKMLAHLNVRALQDCTQFLSSEAKPWAKYLFDSHIINDERGRPCSPSLYASKIIYDSLLSMPEALIGLQVNLIQESGHYLSRFTVLFEVLPLRTLKVIDPEDIPSTQSIYMFVGCRYLSQPHVNVEALKAEFNQRSLEEIIFAHEVTYPQYPKSLKVQNIQPDEPELKKEIERLKKMQGFSLEDPSDLCLVHIFVDDTQSQALSAYDPPVYLPKLSEKQSYDESSYKANDSRVEIR